MTLRQHVTDTVAFYDRMREDHTEYTSRHMAEAYLMRKAPEVTADGAAVLLANALAWRAASRITINNLENNT